MATSIMSYPQTGSVTLTARNMTARILGIYNMPCVFHHRAMSSFLNLHTQGLTLSYYNEVINNQ